MHDLININEVMALTTLSRSTLHRYIKAGNFPAPVKYANRFLWREKLIKSWIDAQLGKKAP